MTEHARCSVLASAGDVACSAARIFSMAGTLTISAGCEAESETALRSRDIRRQTADRTRTAGDEHKIDATGRGSGCIWSGMCQAVDCVQMRTDSVPSLPIVFKSIARLPIVRSVPSSSCTRAK